MNTVVNQLGDKLATVRGPSVQAHPQDVDGVRHARIGCPAPRRGTVGIFVTAQAEASGQATSELFSLGLAIANATATINIGDDAVRPGRRLGEHRVAADVTAKMKTSTKRDLGAVPQDPTETALSFAVAIADLTSTATLADTAVIEAGRTVNFRALGTKATEAEAESGMYADGTASISGAVQVSDATVTATVGGRITAKMEEADGPVVGSRQARVRPHGRAGPDRLRRRGQQHDLRRSRPRSSPVTPSPTPTGTARASAGSPSRAASPTASSTTSSTSRTIRPPRSTSRRPSNLRPTSSTRTAGPRSTCRATASIRSASTAWRSPARPRRTPRRSTPPPSTPPRTRSRSPTRSSPPPVAGARLVAARHTRSGSGRPSPTTPTGQAPIPGLVDGAIYYVIVDTGEFNLQGDLRFTTGQVIRLAESENEALAGVGIDIGAGNRHRLHAQGAPRARLRPGRRDRHHRQARDRGLGERRGRPREPEAGAGAEGRPRLLRQDQGRRARAC